MERPGHRHRQGRSDVHPPRLHRRGHRHRRGDSDRGDGFGEEGGRGDRRDAPGRINFFRIGPGTRPGPTRSSGVPPGGAMFHQSGVRAGCPLMPGWAGAHAGQERLQRAYPPPRPYLRFRYRTKLIPTPKAARIVPNPGVVVRSDCPGARSEGICTTSVSRPARTVISQTIRSLS